MGPIRNGSNLMGIPWLEALEDAEAQEPATWRLGGGDVWADRKQRLRLLAYRALSLAGASTGLARYLTLTDASGFRRSTITTLIPELIKLSENLVLLQITREQL